MNQDDYLKSGRCQLAPNAMSIFHESTCKSKGYIKRILLNGLDEIKKSEYNHIYMFGKRINGNDGNFFITTNATIAKLLYHDGYEEMDTDCLFDKAKNCKHIISAKQVIGLMSDKSIDLNDAEWITSCTIIGTTHKKTLLEQLDKLVNYERSLPKSRNKPHLFSDDKFNISVYDMGPFVCKSSHKVQQYVQEALGEIECYRSIHKDEDTMIDEKNDSRNTVV